MDFNKYFDHTLLKPEATETQILKICEEALEYDFASVCVNSCHVKLVSDKLSGSDVKTAAVVGFPLGAMSTPAKAAETSDALTNGADEIDMVINVGALKESRDPYVLDEITELASLCHAKGVLLKVIIETCLLTYEEIARACVLSVRAGADFVKTSTGFSTGGATVEALQIMKQNISPDTQIKASGGIRTLADAEKFIAAGADRLGCSASVSIMKEYLDTQK